MTLYDYIGNEEQMSTYTIIRHVGCVETVDGRCVILYGAIGESCIPPTSHYFSP